MENSLRRKVLFVISCLSLIMSCYICYRINTDPEYTQEDTPVELEVPEVTFENRDAGIRIQWKEIDGAVNYRVNRKEDDGQWEVYDYTAQLAFDDNAVEAGKIYYYRVYALSEKQTSSGSESVKVLRLVSPEIAAVEAADDGVAISWNAVASAGYYYVYRSTDGNKFERASDRITGLSYLDSSAVRGNTYYYCVKAASSNNTYVSSRSEVLSIDY